LEECDNKRDELATEGKELNIEFRKNMNDVNRGMICSVCRDTKNEIENSGTETFEQHLVSVRGVAIQPTAFDMQEKQNDLKRQHNKQIDWINERIDSHNKDCRQKVIDWSEEQNRLAEEKRQEQQQKKLEAAEAAAQAEQDMLDKMREDQEAIEEENERRREEQMRQALANQRETEADLLNYTRNELSALREISNSNVEQEVEEIYMNNEKYLGVSIGNGLSDKNNDYSFDSNKMSDEFSDVSYDDDFFQERSDNTLLEVVSDKYEDVGNYFTNKFGRMKDRANNLFEKGHSLFENVASVIDFDEVAIAGYFVDDNLGTSIGHFNEFTGHYDSQSDFIDKYEDRAKKYWENFNNNDPGYNVNDEVDGVLKDYEYMVNDMIKNKTGVNINYVKSWFSDKD
jgi:hypothetical protein